MWLGPNTCRWLYSNFFSGFIPDAWRNMTAMHDLWVSVFINNNLQICGTYYVVVQQLHLVLLYEICVQCLEFCLNASRKSRKREVVIEAQNLAWVWSYYAGSHQLVWILLSHIIGMCQESMVELLGLWFIWVCLCPNFPITTDVQENSVKPSFRSISSVATIIAKSDQLVRATLSPPLLN
jgi:hypothetical protein